MNTQTISYQTESRSATRLTKAEIPQWTRSLPCQAFMTLVSAIPSVALVLLATAAINVPTILPAVQAAVGLTGFVFLALAIDSSRLQAILHIVTAAALFGLAWASMAVVSEMLIPATMLIAAWTGAGTLALVRKNCL